MISVFCASRLIGDQRVGKPLLLDAIESVFAQRGHTVDEIVVGLDVGVPHPDLGDKRVRFVNSEGNRQALAVTAAMRECKGDIICGLEDDDFWSYDKLELQLPYLHNGYDFVSGDVAEYHIETGTRLENRYNAFVSTWVMKRAVLDTVGAYFDRDVFYHVDVEWLGRLNAHPEFKRVHLVESEAMPPVMIRQELNELGRHSHVRGVLFQPLVRRLVGYGSRGIEANLSGSLVLQADGERIMRQRGYFPW